MLNCVRYLDFGIVVYYGDFNMVDGSNLMIFKNVKKNRSSL